MHLFVYGTLLRGLRAYKLLHDHTFMGFGVVKGKLINVDWYPGLVEGELCVFGEVYRVEEEIVSRLDRFEDYNPDEEKGSLFLRRKKDVWMLCEDVKIDASCYIFNADIPPDSQAFSDYRVFLLKHSSNVMFPLVVGRNDTGSFRGLLDGAASVDTGIIKDIYLESCRDGYRCVYSNGTDEFVDVVWLKKELIEKLYECCVPMGVSVTINNKEVPAILPLCMDTIASYRCLHRFS